MFFDLILQSLYFLAPAGFAILTPHLCGRLKIFEFMNIPVDLGYTYRGKRILGDHKTVRGFIVGTLTAAFIGWVQYLLSSNDFVQNYSIADYSNIYFAIGLAFLLGFGGLVGDSVKSFFKRQIGVAPGKSWMPFDQIDFIIGAYIFALPIIVLPIYYLIIMLAIYFGIHIISTSIGYLMGLNENWV